MIKVKDNLFRMQPYINIHNLKVLLAPNKLLIVISSYKLT